MRRLAIVLPAAVVLSIVTVPPLGASPQEGIETSRTTTDIAPGLRLTEFDRFDPDGWIRGDLLTADLSSSALRPEYLSPPAVSDATPLTEQAAGSGAVAGVNGDFFDIDVTNAPLGVGIDDGQLRQAPSKGHNHVVSMGDQVARMMQVFLDARFTRADGSATPITDLNPAKVSANGIGLYTPLWGGASRSSAVEGAQRVTEVEVIDGVIRRVIDAPAAGPVPENGLRLLGVDAGADALRSLRQGERIEVSYQPRVDGQRPTVAVGGNKVLLRDGVIQQVDDSELHPRTAAGFSADGKRMWLLTVDGRQADSRGMTERELAEELRALGADDALNLDGGGSSTLLAREPGAPAATVHNAPSDGELRPVPNGIGFSTAAGSGQLRGFRVEPTTPTPNSNRVLSGLTRRVSAYGHDEMGAPVVAAPSWRVAPGEAGEVADGTFRAEQPGVATVTAEQGGATGDTRLDVLGPLHHLTTDVERVALPSQGARGRFQVLGQDESGFQTWVEPADVRLEYDRAALSIVPSGDGFEVTALAPSASVVTARVGSHVTHFGVTVGSEPQQLSPMDEVRGWRASVYPEPVTASLSQAPGRADTPGIALDYSLTGTTATRAAYVNADPMLPLPAGTQKLGVWVHGDGRGGWLRATVVDSTGTSSTIDLARHVDWTGWRYVEAAMPTGTAEPLQLQRLYVVESDAARQYSGRLVFDDLTAAVAPPAQVPADPAWLDPAVVRDGTLSPEPNTSRVAVVSDAQFTADDPNGPLVRQARRTLRAALATKPDMVVLNGDFVDRGTAADFDLARQVLDSELGDRVPWYYVPGNHEAEGPGDLSEFRAEFGETHRVVDSAGQRSVFLDSSRGSLRAGGFEQVRMLHDALKSAERDPSIHSVAVFLHHPVDDPAPADASELSDPKEADLLTEWLTEFEQASGKPAVAVTAHAGAFHASTEDGVPYLVNGNAGKAPSLAPEQGGFTGLSLLRIDPDEHGAEIRWETRPHVDELRLAAADRITVGQREDVGAQVRQADRIVPVTYPVSAEWSGSGNVHIGIPEEAGPKAIAAYDVDSGTLVGLRPGRGSLTVTVNGVKRTTEFSVTP